MGELYRPCQRDAALMSVKVITADGFVKISIFQTDPLPIWEAALVASAGTPLQAQDASESQAVRRGPDCAAQPRH